MNERIRELYDQASIRYSVYEILKPRDERKSIPDIFAELIVRECALVAKTLPHTPERHWVTDSVTYIPVHCEQNILKHFGVEE